MLPSCVCRLVDLLSQARVLCVVLPFSALEIFPVPVLLLFPVSDSRPVLFLILLPPVLVLLYLVPVFAVERLESFYYLTGIHVYRLITTYTTLLQSVLCVYCKSPFVFLIHC